MTSWKPSKKPSQATREELFARSRAWMISISRSDNQLASDLGDLFRILLGLWICESATKRGNRSQDLITVARQVESELLVVADSFDPSRYDSKLLFLCTMILTEQGLNPYPIASFAKEVASALAQLPVLPPRYIGEAVVLSQLGHQVMPPTLPIDTTGVGSDGLELILSDPEQVRAVCDSIATATHFGRQRVEMDAKVERVLTRILPILLLQSLREYRLELGAALLRSLRYLRLSETPAVRCATSFLISQSKPKN